MINFPTAQSIRMRPIASAMPNFDNTFDQEPDSIKGLIIPWIQYVYPGPMKFQAITDTVTEHFPMMYYLVDGVEHFISSTNQIKSGIRYSTFDMDFAPYDGKVVQLKGYDFNYSWDPQARLVYMSEPFMVQEKSSFLKLQWFNLDQNSIMDYSVDLIHELWVESELELQPYAGESSVYKNQGIYTKIKETNFRTFSLECQVPKHIVEEMQLAMECDRFYVNEVAYMVEKKPSFTRLSKSNLYQFEAELIQSTAVGINTHDVGYNVLP